MSLEKDITSHIKEAMKAKNKVKLDTLRAVKTAITLEKTKTGADELADDAVLKLIQKLVKQRKDAAETYKEGGREELAQKELDEVKELEPFLPKQLTDEEVLAHLQKVIEEVGAAGPQDMGKVMGKANKELSGQAEGKRIADLVKQLPPFKKD